MALAPLASPPSSLAQKTLDQLVNSLEGSSTAGLADIVKLVQMLSSDSADISIHQLADIIEKDSVVSTKCIAAANKLGYNIHGVEIATIPQAVQVVGFNKIRSLAVSLLLLENAAALNQPEPRKNTKTSLCNGLFCRAWARAMDRPDPDRHFLCGSLRNFGRLLVSTHQTDAYRSCLVAASGGLTEDEAFRQTFGLTPTELTYQVLAKLALPAPVLRMMSPLPADQGKKTPQNETEEIAVVSDFFLRFCEIALDEHLKPLDYQEALAALIKRFAGLSFTEEGLDVLLEQTEMTLKIYGEGSSLGQVAGPLISQLAHRRVRVVAPKEKKEEPAVAKAPEPLTAPAQPLVLTLETAVAVLSDELVRPLVRLEKVISPALGSLQEQWKPSVLALFLGSHGSFRFVAPTTFPGSPKGKPTAFRLGEANILSLCVNRGDPLALPDLTESRLQTALPAWLAEHKLKSCLILPSGARENCGLVVFMGWEQSQRANLSPELLREHRTLFNLVLTAQRIVSLQ